MNSIIVLIFYLTICSAKYKLSTNMSWKIREGVRKFSEAMGLKKEIPTFGLESIREMEGKYRLHIILAKTGFLLPLVHLNIPYPNEAAIGWFDPNPGKNPQIAEAAGETMGNMLKKICPKVVVMTNSTKSEYFIQEAVKKLPKGTRLILLPSGVDEKDVNNRSSSETIDYIPVTGTRKWIGYPKKEESKQDYLSLEELKKLCPNGNGLVIVDDVYTTGATVKAMEEILEIKATDKHKVVVIAIEKKFNGRYENSIAPKNVQAAFILTEFQKLDELGLDRDKLHKYEKSTIPPAIVDSRKQ